VNENEVICNYCEQVADGVTYDSQPICNDCSMMCDGCGDVGHADDAWYSVNGCDHWCENCISDAYWCERCEDYESESGYYIQDRGENWCGSCTQHNANWCDECDHYTAGECDSCYNGDSYNGVRVIHDYSYRPDAIFHTTKDDERLYFGFELEMELGDYRTEAAGYAHTIIEGNDLAYLKNDGSLEEGFELVTHPMSFDFLMSDDNSGELWKVIHTLNKTYSATSYNTRTCGFHIHISRTGFSGGAHMHRFLNLVYSNDEFFSKLAGRKSDQWAKFDDVYSRKLDLVSAQWVTYRSFKEKLESRGDRYSAVNTNNRDTLEVRIFKGTMSIDALKAHIQLVHASVEYTRNLSVKDVAGGALMVQNFIDYIYANDTIYPQLIARIVHKNLTLTCDAEQSVGISRQNRVPLTEHERNFFDRNPEYITTYTLGGN
jgi:hypothetical protein